VTAAFSVFPPYPGIVYVEFHYGSYCRPGNFCVLTLPGRGYVVFHLRGLRPDMWVRVSVDDHGAVSATAPEPFPPGVGGASGSPAPTVVCGRLDAQPCEAAIDLVREAHPRDVAAAWAIVVDDVCPPTMLCDRLYPFDSVVVLVPSPGLSADPLAFEVVGLDDKPERAEAWTGSLPPHIVALIQSLH